MNELMPTTAVNRPFTRPTSTHMSIASSKAGMSGSPAPSANSWKMNGANR